MAEARLAEARLAEARLAEARLVGFEVRTGGKTPRENTAGLRPKNLAFTVGVKKPVISRPLRPACQLRRVCPLRRVWAPARRLSRSKRGERREKNKLVSGVLRASRVCDEALACVLFGLIGSKGLGEREGGSQCYVCDKRASENRKQGGGEVRRRAGGSRGHGAKLRRSSDHRAGGKLRYGRP